MKEALKLGRRNGKNPLADLNYAVSAGLDVREKKYSFPKGLFRYGSLDEAYVYRRNDYSSSMQLHELCAVGKLLTR